MATTEDLEMVRQALLEADDLDPTDIDLAVEDGSVVLRGAVSTFEEATAAQAAAALHTDEVRNELRVDPNIRENPAGVEEADVATRESLHGSTVEAPSAQGDDLQTDVQLALDENLPWDPPDSPSNVPTLAEERGIVDRDVTVPEAADEGDLDADAAEETTPSLPDLSAAELARSAKPTPQEDT